MHGDFWVGYARLIINGISRSVDVKSHTSYCIALYSINLEVEAHSISLPSPNLSTLPSQTPRPHSIQSSPDGYFCYSTLLQLTAAFPFTAAAGDPKLTNCCCCSLLPVQSASYTGLRPVKEANSLLLATQRNSNKGLPFADRILLLCSIHAVGRTFDRACICGGILNFLAPSPGAFLYRRKKERPRLT